MRRDKPIPGMFVGVLALVALLFPVEARGISAEGQQATLLVRPQFLNESPGPDPDADVAGAAMFNGHVGAYALPALDGGEGEGEGEDAMVPTDGSMELTHSAFGQPCATYVAYKDFAKDVTDRARNMLFLQENAGGRGGLVDWGLRIVGSESPNILKSANSISVSPAAYRVDDAAGEVTFDITVSGTKDVHWSAAVAEGNFLSVQGSSSGIGAGAITVHFDENTGGVRWGYIRIEGWTETLVYVGGVPLVVQERANGSPACGVVAQGAAENILTISPQSTIVADAGGSVEIQVSNAGTGTMDWTAAISEGEGFLMLDPAEPGGTDDGQFTVQVEPNTGPPRTGIVFVNSPGAVGSPATLTLFQQGSNTYEPNFGEVPKDIPNPGAVASNLTVGDSVVVVHVDLWLHITHTWDEDLDVSLRSPSGREIVLFSGVGGGGDNFGDETTPLSLDDTADLHITEGTAPFAGAFRPQEPLSLFNGENALGVWTLTISDTLKQDPDADPPAFRFIEEIYGDEDGTVASQLENRLLTEAEIDQLLAEMYGPDEAARVREAEILVRDALRYAPFDKRLRNVLLDIFYHRCVANTLVAKERLVRAYKKRIDVPQPGERVIDKEIAYFSDALEAYRTAADPYYELFTDGMGVKVAELDPGYPTHPPFGYYVFVTEVPRRSLLAATFRDENDNPQPVVAGAKDGEPATLLSGYKDWAILFGILRDQAVAARELALHYLMRGNSGDIEASRSLINEVMLQMDIEGNVLLGIFPDYEPADIGPNSGVPEAIASWQSAVNDLEALRQFMAGELNLLGFREDFLMLVQSFEDIKDSFDALVYWNDATDPTTPLGAAVAKLEEARSTYEAYRGSQDELGRQLDWMVNSNRVRLAAITGVDPGPDPANPAHPAYLTPAENEGSEINLQVTSIRIAANRIMQNSQEIANLKEQVEIEVQRRAQEAGISANIQSIRVRYGNKQANLTEEIAHIEALQIRARNLADAANAVSVSVGVTGPSVSVSGGAVAYTVNAFLQYDWEEEKGDLKAEKEKLSALEQAEIQAQEDALLDVNSKANIKTWLLRMKTLQLQSQEAQLMLNQEVARLAGLFGEKAAIEARMAEVSRNLLTRYYADPTHRLRYQGAMLDAQKAFEEAQKWVYFTLRAFEYKHNIPDFVTPDGYSLNSVFAARTADELVDIVTAVKAYDVALGLPGGVAKEDWLSFTEDILGYRHLDGGGTPILYPDPITGKPNVTATEIFRSFLLSHMDDSGAITIDFSSVLDNGVSFFFGPRYLADGTLATPGAFLDKINYMKINLVGDHSVRNTTVAGALTQGGIQFVRNIDVGTFEPETPNRILDEMTAWSPRFWFLHPGNPGADPPVPPRWRFNEGLTANVVLNLTDSERDETTSNTFDEFGERSVAATDWRLVIFTEESGESRLNIEELDDLEIYFNHRAKNRPFTKSEEDN